MKFRRIPWPKAHDRSGIAIIERVHRGGDGFPLSAFPFIIEQKVHLPGTRQSNVRERDTNAKDLGVFWQCCAGFSPYNPQGIKDG